MISTQNLYDLMNALPSLHKLKHMLTVDLLPSSWTNSQETTMHKLSSNPNYLANYSTNTDTLQNHLQHSHHTQVI